jgi:hypothetical protein
MTGPVRPEPCAIIGQAEYHGAGWGIQQAQAPIVVSITLLP